MMEKTINERVQQLIDALSKSTNGFAKSIGRQSSAVTHITSGRSKPGFEFLEAVCEAYPQVNADWLIRGEGEMFISSATHSIANETKPDSYLQDQIKKLEENFSRLANQLEVKDTQIQSLSEMLKITLGKSRDVMRLTSIPVKRLRPEVELLEA